MGEGGTNGQILLKKFENLLPMLPKGRNREEWRKINYNSVEEARTPYWFYFAIVPILTWYEIAVQASHFKLLGKCDEYCSSSVNSGDLNDIFSPSWPIAPYSKRPK